MLLHFLLLSSPASFASLTSWLVHHLEFTGEITQLSSAISSVPVRPWVLLASWHPNQPSPSFLPLQLVSFSSPQVLGAFASVLLWSQLFGS